MQRSYILSIPTPCHESWDEMTSTEQGRFCQSCQKTVTDFSAMSDQEIIALLNTSRGDLCGNFRKSQLNREISIPASKRQRPLISIAAMLAALTISIPSLQARSKAEKIQTIPVPSDTTIVPPKESDKLSLITGIVTDHTGEILIGVSIRLDTSAIRTDTDTSGRFRLQIPSDYTEKTVRISLDYVGFNTQECILPLTGNTNTTDEPMLCITMEPNEKGGIIRRAPLWYRVKYKIRRFFS